jgi:foldase protein PrsA
MWERGTAAVAAVLTLTIAAGCGGSDDGNSNQEVPAGVVALVQDAPAESAKITEGELKSRVEGLAAASAKGKRPKPGDKGYASLEKQTLEQLLEEAWIAGEAKEMGIAATEKELADELAKQKQGAGKEGTDEARAKTEEKILSTKIQKQVLGEIPAPSSDEIEKYYSRMKASKFTQVPTLDIRVVLSKDMGEIETAKSLLEKDHSAAGWKRVTKQFSKEPATKNEGGLFEDLEEGQAVEPLNAAAFKAAEDRVEGPVKTAQGYYVFEVSNLNPGSVEKLEDTEAQIKTELGKTAESEAFATFSKDYFAKWSSRTVCAIKFALKRCSNFEAAKPASASGPSGKQKPAQKPQSNG